MKTLEPKLRLWSCWLSEAYCCVKNRVTVTFLVRISNVNRGYLAVARWAGWSAGQVGRHIQCWSRLNDSPLTRNNSEGGREENEGQSHKKRAEGRREWNGEEGLGTLSFTWIFVYPESIVMPLLMGPVCLLSQDLFEEPIRPWMWRQRDENGSLLIVLKASSIIIVNLVAIFSYQIADIYHAMADHQKNTKFNWLAAYNQKNSSKYSTSQKYTMKQKKGKKTNRQRTRQRATRGIGCEIN